MFYFASIKNIENLSANGSMHPNIIGTNSLYRFKQYKVLSCALISDLHFPPLYWMETLRFLALSGLDLENIYENAYFHILNSENWQEKNALKNLVLILVLPLPTCLAYSELSIPSRLSFLHFQNEWFGPDNWPSNCASEILLKVLGWQSPHSSYFPILSAIKIT